MSSRRWLSIAAPLAFVLAAFPLLEWYASRVTDGSDEPLGVVALVAALAFLGAAACRENERPSLLAGRLLAGSVLLLGLRLSGLPLPPLVVGLLAVAVLAIGLRMPRGKPGLTALLVLSLPLVASLNFYAGYPLRLAIAEIAGVLLRLGGVAVEQSGVMLIDGERLVGIDPPCAGVRMLWSSCFVTAVIALRMGLGWTRTAGLFVAAVACVIAGNGLRAAIVFFPESGRVEWPEWAHPGVGLIVHALVLLAILGFGGRLGRYKHGVWRIEKRYVAGGFAAFLLAAVLLAASRETERPESAAKVSEWPSTLDGTPLVRQPLSPLEQRFSRAFPGAIARFSWGDAEVILRRTDRATRMMHPAGDCLRAAGFEVHSEPVHRDADGRLWGESHAFRNGRKWIIHERYVATDGEARTDASSWYWHAWMHPGQGPWMAITILRPEADPHPLLATVRGGE